MRETPLLHVSTREQRQYDAAAAQCVRKALEAHALHRPKMPGAGWSLVRRQRHLAVYKAAHVTAQRDPNATVLCAIGRIPGTVTQVMDGLYSDTTESLQAVKAMVGHSLMDGRVLHVSERRSDELPFRFAGIKWFAAKAAWGLAGHRDVLSFERMGVARDEDDNEFAYHVVSSIRRPEWPHNVLKGVRRQDVAACFLYRPLGNSGFVETFGWCEAFELGAARSARLAEYVIAGSMLGVEHAAAISRAKRFSRFMAIVHHDRWPPSYLCHVCYDRPFLTSHHQCAACLQSTCMSCLSRHQLFKLDKRTKRPLERRFCRLCVEVVLSCSSDDESVDLSSSRAIFSSEIPQEPEPEACISTGPTETARVQSTSTDKRSTAVAAMAPAPTAARSQVEPVWRQPGETVRLGRSPSVNCVTDLASMTRSTRQPPVCKIVSVRPKPRRGGSCRFPSSSSPAPSSGATTTSMSSVATKASGPPPSRDDKYTFVRPLEECLQPQDDSIQLADLVLSSGSSSGRLVSSFKKQRRSGKREQAFTIDTINNSSVSTSRMSTTAFAPGLSQFELEVDLSAVLRAACADIGDTDDDNVSVESDDDPRSRSSCVKVLVTSNGSSRGEPRASKGADKDKSSFLADLYSLSLSMSD